MRQVLFTVLFVVSFISCENQNQSPKPSPLPDLTQFVDPFIGTADHGHTYPGATVPFGMVQLSPDNGRGGWDWCSGYNYVDSVIAGFSHTHLSGTGIGDLLDILVMPTTNSVDLAKPVKSREDYGYTSSFSHENETAEPGYYSVKLLDTGIQAELTTTKRVGFHKYTFPKHENSQIIVDLGYMINWDQPVELDMEAVGEDMLVGRRFSTGWAKDQRVYFAMKFSKPFASVDIQKGGTSARDQAVPLMAASASFPTTEGEVIMVKVGLSSASKEGAIAALEEVPGWDFDAVRATAKADWNKALNAIHIEDENLERKKVFYTALYHTHLAPVFFSDANGAYKGVDGKVHMATGDSKYDIFSLWDTFRAEHPLMTLIRPEMVNDFVSSIMSHYRESNLLPVWSLLGNETNTMTGYHAVPVVADAYLKDLVNLDGEEIFEAMKKSAMQDIRATNHYRDHRYIPHDSAGQSVTRTLEYCYDDWCIAQMAKALGKDEDYKIFMDRATWYRNLFDPSTGFMRAKMANGDWKVPFDPKYSSHDFDVAEYTEGNAWQHSWFVPHDPAGLIQLHGGNEKFIEKLDEMFAESSEISGDFVSSDISGLIGQYAHGNEPSHHIGYLYNYAGAPYKTQATVRNIMVTQYTTEPNGICGNEDCGQMSAWYVFSALGFYPVNPASGIYVIGSPEFQKATMKVADGKTFTVVAANNSDKNIYIQAASLNSQPLIRTFLTHEEITSGGKLEFVMGPNPNPEWGSSPESYPPSMSN